MYNQIYIYDVEEAVHQRMTNPANGRCNFDLMHELSTYINEVNPFARQFRNMHEAVQEQIHTRGQTDLYMYIISDKSQDQRRYNSPTSNDVAAVFRAEDGAAPSERGLFVYPYESNITPVSMLHPALDPLAYPLLFPHGDHGWSPEMTHLPARATAHRNKTTQLQYAAYRLSVRNEDFSILHSSGKLFLQWCVDMYTRIEGERLDFIRRNQEKLRRDMYINLMDYVQNRAEDVNVPPGRIHILPSSFKGKYNILNM